MRPLLSHLNCRAFNGNGIDQLNLDYYVLGKGRRDTLCGKSVALRHVMMQWPLSYHSGCSHNVGERRDWSMSSTIMPPTQRLYSPPTYRWRRTIALAALAVLAGVVLGFAAGVLYGRMAGWADPNWWLRNWAGVIWSAVIAGAVFGVLTAPCVALLLWRKNLLVALPLLYGATILTVTWFAGISLVMIAVAVVSICGISVLLKFTLPDRIRKHQANTCPACEFNLTGVPSPVCPECGVPISIPKPETVEQPLYRYPVWSSLAVLVLGALTAMITLGALYAVLRIDVSSVVPVTFSVGPTSSVTWPTAKTFVQHWNSGMKRGRSGMWWGQGVCDADHVYFPAGDGRDRVIEVLIPLSGAPASAPAMQIRLAYMYRDSRGNIGPYSGDPAVIANLNSSQAQHVWKNDIPKPLIGAMLQAADQAGWEPLDPAKGVHSKPHLEVDANPHFP